MTLLQPDERPGPPIKVAVTGATGFVGRHVLAELDKYPVEVTATARHAQPDIPLSARLKFVSIDLKEISSNPFGCLGQPDVLIHLAWGGLPNYKAMQHFEVELPRQYQFLKEMVNSGLKSLFVAGTCFEYGMQSGPLNENMDTHPSTPYGFAKDILRRQLEYLQMVKPFALTWGRLFYLYGDCQSQTSLYSQLSAAIEHGDRSFKMSGGEQLRDYLPIAVAAKHIVAQALKAKDIGIVNICSGTPISVRKLVEGWVEELRSEIKLDLGYFPYPDYEPLAFWGDRTKLDRCEEKK